jgi:Zn-dependent protease
MVGGLALVSDIGTFESPRESAPHQRWRFSQSWFCLRHMLGWSINLFRIRGIQLALHGSFLLLLGYVAWAGWQENGGAGILDNVIQVVLLFTCVVLHELGHSFTARHFGVVVPRILLLPIGGMAEFDSIPRKPGSELLIALAGPAVNFALVSLLLVAGALPGFWTPWPSIPVAVLELLQLMLVVNLIMGVFNLVPVFPMDGGRVLRALLVTRFGYLRATFIAASVAKVLSLVGVAAMLWLPEQANWLGAILFVFIFVAGELEYRAVKRREMEAEHWQRVFARIYGPVAREADPSLTTPSEPTR